MEISKPKKPEPDPTYFFMIMFSVVGVVLTCLVAWHYETKAFDASQRYCTASYSRIYFADKAQLPILVKLGDEQKNKACKSQKTFYPESAAEVELALQRTFLFPWPVIGMALGLTLLLAMATLAKRLGRA